MFGGSILHFQFVSSPVHCNLVLGAPCLSVSWLCITCNISDCIPFGAMTLSPLNMIPSDVDCDS